MNKFHARRCKLDGYTFDSMVERDRYSYLRLLAIAGELLDLQVHPKVSLTDAKLEVTLDFRYGEYIPPKWTIVYEDVKGEMTASLERWRIIKQLWPHYGLGTLREVQRVRGKWKVKEIQSGVKI